MEAPLADPRQPPVRAVEVRRPGWRFSRVGLFVIVLFGVLYQAAELFIPIAIAVLFTLLLSPIVRRLSRLGLPRALAAALVVMAALGVIGSGVWALSGPALEWVESAPRSLHEARDKLDSLRRSLEDVQKATQEVAEAAEQATGGNDPTRPPPQKVVVQEPGLAFAFVVGTGQVLATAMVTVVLLYFILASGDVMLRKALRLAPTLGHKRRTVRIFRRAERDVSLYLGTITLINAALGAITAGAMWALDMPNPLLWGAMAGVLNYVPFLGAATTLVVIAVVSLISEPTILDAALPPLVFFALTAAEGQLVTPALVGRRLTVNPVAVFLALMVWGWMWGVPGILLAVPLLTTFKIVCDATPAMAPIAQLLDRR